MVVRCSMYMNLKKRIILTSLIALGSTCYGQSNNAGKAGFVQVNGVPCSSALPWIDFKYDSLIWVGDCDCIRYYHKDTIKYAQVVFNGKIVHAFSGNLGDAQGVNYSRNISWYSDESLREEYFQKRFPDGNIETIGREFYQNGDLHYKIYFDDSLSKFIHQRWNRAGLMTLFSESVDGWGAHGVQKSWFDNGNLKYSILAGEGQQPFYYYHENGNPQVEGNCFNHTPMQSGTQKFYYPSGQIESIEEYGLYEEFGKANIKHGVWKFWDESGQLYKIEEYSNDSLLRTETFDVPELKIKER